MDDVSPVRMIIVGGFLGSGKTTLVARAAEALIRRGRRVGLITNDQAKNLVDTDLLRERGFGVKEVTGSCFCCGFHKLVASADELIEEFRPDVLIAEPVGSCADLSATVLQPIRKYCGDRIELSPFSVLADPARLAEGLGRRVGQALAESEEAAAFPQAVLYIFRKQLEEADLIVLNKLDTLPPEQADSLARLTERHFPPKPVLAMSALHGQGVEAWLDRVLTAPGAGQTVLDIDYDTYAAGEAALGWLNATVRLRAVGQADWWAFCRSFLERLQRQVGAEQAEVGHVKILLKTQQGSLGGSLTATGGRPALRGTLSGSPPGGTLIVNARVAVSPRSLQSAVESCLHSAAGDDIEITITDLASLQPARPKPTHRIRDVL
jgi:Ni2+-binding GTPase involved in maturation of urease and hydrogenase